MRNARFSPLCTQWQQSLAVVLVYAGLSTRCVEAWTSDELHAMPRGGSPCVPGDPFACWGNGHCTEQQQHDGESTHVPPHSCVCTRGWTGFNCTVLDLAPGPADGAVRRKGWSTWGGSPIVDEGVSGHLMDPSVRTLSLTHTHTHSLTHSLHSLCHGLSISVSRRHHPSVPLSNVQHVRTRDMAKQQRGGASHGISHSRAVHAHQQHCPPAVSSQPVHPSRSRRHVRALLDWKPGTVYFARVPTR